jgi:hypothetical protein
MKVIVEDLVSKPECFVLKSPSGNLITICFNKFCTKWRCERNVGNNAQRGSVSTGNKTNGVGRLYLEGKMQLIHFHKNKTVKQIFWPRI